MQRRIAFAASFFLVLLSSCGGPGTEAQQATVAAPKAAGPLAAVQAGLPALHSLPAARKASESFQFRVEGSDELQASLGAQQLQPSALQLGSLPGGLAYAIYGFNLPGVAEEIGLLAAEVFGLRDPGIQYLAISNFSQNRWEIIEIEALTTSSQNLVDTTIRSAPDYVNANSDCFVAVLAADGQGLTVDSVTLGIDGILVPPTELTTNGVGMLDTHFDRVELNWTAVEGVDGYDIFFRPASAGPEGEFIQLVSPLAGQTSFDHSNVAPLGDECPYNEVCEYKIRSRSGELESVFSNTVTGLRSVPPPAQVVCSVEESDWSIEIRFSSVEGATEFKVYRDSPDSEPVVITIDNNAFDSDVDFAAHSYYVRSFCEEGDGLFAQVSSNQGSRVQWTTHSLLETGSGVDGAEVSMAIIAGRPAFAFSRSTLDTLGYASAKSGEPGSGTDWDIMNISDAEVGSVCLVNHKDTPWIIFHDQLPSTDVVRIARSSKSHPSSNGDWTSYQLHNRGASGAGVRLIESDGLLRALIPEAATEGGKLLYAMALDSQPEQAEWDITRQNAVATHSKAIDLALVDGEPAVVYSDGLLLHYAHTSLPNPESEDWESSIAVTAAESEIIYADLIQRGSGVPALAWIEMQSGFESVLYRESTVAQVSDQQDWRPAVELTLADGLLELALGEYLGRPLLIFADPNVFNDQELTIWQFKDLVPAENGESSRYKINPSNGDSEIAPAVQLLDHAGRPAIVFVQQNNVTAEFFPRYGRVQPKP